VDIVVHTAALKQVPVCEYNPFEAIQTNVIGAQNVIKAAIDCNVSKVIALSTDKAVNPINLYGATKLSMEKIFVAANSYVGKNQRTQVSCVRYGNVLGSRGSVLPLFRKQKLKGVITITDERMTRFWMTLEQGVKFVIKSIGMMQKGEIFIPKMPSMKIVDLAKLIAPKCKINIMGIRPGEKIHECLLTEYEAIHSVEYENFFIIKPEWKFWKFKLPAGGKKLPEDFRYTSDKNNSWLSCEELKEMVQDL
jgi:UDP-N-acetylglucosamine 4,6-dehydratase